MEIETLKTEIQESLQQHITHVTDIKGELALTVTPTSIRHVLLVLRNNSRCQFHQLIDLCAVDYLGKTPRFAVVYHLLSLKFNARLRIKVYIDEGGVVPSVATIYNAANWYEREIWDLYGIPFEGHPDMRRILTDYGFEGHPLRKDFPLTGYVEVRYDHEQKRVMSKPVQLVQDFRSFDYTSPWEGHVPTEILSPVLPEENKVKPDESE